MEWLSTILTSTNAPLVICGVIVLVLLLAFLSKKGIISFKGKGFTLGHDSIERTVVRQQIEYVRTHTEIMANDLISKFKDADEWRVRYICELIEDVYIDAVSFNHITKDTFYVENKFDKIWSIILKETVTDRFHDEKFKSMVKAGCKEVVERLVDIKEYYSKG